jgi:hypothetical protein
MAATAPHPARSAVAPRAATPLLPTPTQPENDALSATLAVGATLPALPWFHAYDGSPVDPQSYSQTIGPPTWP